MIIPNRTVLIMDRVNFNNKDVLELGCCGMGKYDIYTCDWWFHKNVKKIAKSIIGLDYNKKMIKEIKSNLGEDYQLQYHNLNEYFILGKKFDIITANEILEHLSDPSECLQSVYDHLKDDGLFVLTTPNAMSHFYFLQYLFLNKINGVSLHDHKMWWCVKTLTNLLEVNGFEIVKTYYAYGEHTEHPIKDKLIFQPLARLLPERMGRNIMLVAKKKE